MDQQEFKNLVGVAITKLEKQGSPSREPDSGGCWYLSSSGKSCIVGHMMPNDQVRKDADKGTPDGLSGVKELFHYKSSAWLSQFTENQINTLSSLQYYHDHCSGDKDFQITINNMRRLHSEL